MQLSQLRTNKHQYTMDIFLNCFFVIQMLDLKVVVKPQNHETLANFPYWSWIHIS